MEQMMKIKKRSGLLTSYEDNMDGSQPGSFRFIPFHRDTGQAATMAATTISGLTESVQNVKDCPNTVSSFSGIPPLGSGVTLKNMEVPNAWGSPSSKCLPDIDTCTSQLCDPAKKTHPEPVLSAYRNLSPYELESMGYPRYDGMVLVNTFEEPFGDIYGAGVWSSLGEHVSSKLARSVVALASYKGRKRFFACTGVFIKWSGSTVIVTSASLVRDCGDENKIAEDLRIVVALPDGQRREGTLLHYTLHYNVALVCVDYNECHPANCLTRVRNGTNVAAVGRIFESGTLMATGGIRFSGSGTLDCQYLRYSTCRITKAGIGGPLITMNGDVIAMNFYDTKIGTPFLPWEIVYYILKSVEEKSKEGKAGKDIDSYENSLLSMYDSNAGEGFSCFEGAGADKKRLNRWPVPMPCWRNPVDVAKDEAACDYVDGVRCTYRGRQKVYLY